MYWRVLYCTVMGAASSLVEFKQNQFVTNVLNKIGNRNKTETKNWGSNVTNMN